MQDEWKLLKIQELCKKVVSGGTPLKSHPEYYENGSIPWLKTGEVKKGLIHETETKISEKGLANSSAKLVPKNSVIIAMYGDGNTAGNVAINKIELTTNQACCNLIIDSKKAYYHYVYYYLKGNYNNLVNLKLGGSQQNLNAQSIKSFPIHTPSLKAQRKIAAILSSYDELIENNKRQIEKLETLAEEIYKEWFVRFRFPNYKETRLDGGIPEHWTVATLGELSDITSSKRIFLSDYVAEGVPFYRSKEIISKYNNQEITDPLFISENRFAEIESRFGSPQKNDILITSVGTLGVPYLVKESDRFYFKDGNLIWFKSRDNLVNKFLYFWLQTDLGQASLLETTIGSSQQAFTIAHLKRVKLLMPSQPILEQFMNIVDPIASQKEILLEANQNLLKTRDLLLPRLISGKLSVADLDIAFPPSMKEEENS